VSFFLSKAADVSNFRGNNRRVIITLGLKLIRLIEVSLR
jgi:hypothetical protein